MKARLPQGYGGGGAANLQQLARQAQKLQEEMDAVSTQFSHLINKRSVIVNCSNAFQDHYHRCKVRHALCFPA